MSLGNLFPNPHRQKPQMYSNSSTGVDKMLGDSVQQKRRGLSMYLDWLQNIAHKILKKKWC